MKTAAARSVQINEEQMGPVARPRWDAQRQKHTEYTHPANDLPVKRESSPPFVLYVALFGHCIVDRPRKPSMRDRKCSYTVDWGWGRHTWRS